MKNLLGKLVRILKIDSEIDSLEEQKTEIPELIQNLRNELANIENHISQKLTTFKSLESQKSEKEQTILEQKDFLLKREDKLKDLKNNKEFHAIQKEISQAKKNLQTLESDLADVLSQLDQHQPQISNIEDSFKEQRDTLETQIQSLLEQASGLDSIIQEKVTLRSNEESLISPSFLNQYKTIKNRISPAMALAEDGNCTECSTRIPPQLYIEIQKLDTLVKCPRCYRILYIEEVLE